MNDVDDVLALLESGSRDEVLSLLAGLSTRERKRLGPMSRRWLIFGSSGRISHDRASLIVIATADGARQARLVATHGWRLTNDLVEDAVELLRRRSPAWLAEFVDSLLDEPGGLNWPIARGIIRAGLSPVPGNVRYLLGTVHGVQSDSVSTRTPLADDIRRDPDLVGDHLLAMLSTERVGRLLASHDGFFERRRPHVSDAREFPEGTWRVALVALTSNGQLERARLLDTVLHALLRDWAAADLGWYVGMHDALAPTRDEVAERQGTYARLLAVEHGPSVKTAQRELLRLVADERMQPELVLAASSAILRRTDKGSVIAQLRFLAELARVRPDLTISDSVIIATEHPRDDVREYAGNLLRQFGVAPTAFDAAAFVRPQVEGRPPADAMRSVRTADELADVLLGLFEHIDAVETERAIDGLLRLADVCPSTGELLMDRAVGTQFYQDDPRIAVRDLTIAWLAPRRRSSEGAWSISLGHTHYPGDEAPSQTFVGAIGRRLSAIAQAVREGRHSSLAFPSYTDFSLNAGELNLRLSTASHSGPCLELELVIALLRVPPAHRWIVDIPAALRGSPAVMAARDGTEPAWLRQVARFRRAKWEPERSVPLFRDGTGNERHSAAGFLARSEPEATVAQELQFGEYETHFEHTLGLGAALLPHDHDVLAAHAHPYLLRDVSKDRACAVHVVDAIARAGGLNGAPASSALVLALSAKDARGRIAAQDALIDLARFGQLDGGELGRQAAWLLTEDLVIGQRISGGLRECVRGSDAIVLPVLDALRAIIPALPGRPDTGAFLGLAAELAERTATTIDLPVEFRDIASSRSTSLTATAARRLLAVRRP